MKLWKTLLVLLGFGAILGFNTVLPGFAVVRSRCCEDIDSPVEEVSQDWKIADAVSGRVDWDPDVVLQHRIDQVQQLNQPNPETIVAGANSLATLGRYDEAQNLLQKLPSDSVDLKNELKAKYQYFEYAASDFKTKDKLKAAIETAKTLSRKYLKSNPRAAVLATVLRIHESYVLENLNSDQRVELWFNLVKDLGIPAVRDSTIALLKDQGPKGDPNLLLMISVIDSTRSQNPNEMRFSLAAQFLVERGIELNQAAFKDDLQASASFNYRHQGESAVGLLIKSAREYRAHRTQFMIDQAKLGRFPEDAGYWAAYKPVERPNLLAYTNWIPVQLRMLEVRIVDPFVLLAMAVFACFLLVCLERIYTKPKPGRQQTFKLSQG